jgi:hypothetical protein
MSISLPATATSQELTVRSCQVLTELHTGTALQGLTALHVRACPLLFYWQPLWADAAAAVAAHRASGQEGVPRPLPAGLECLTALRSLDLTAA